MNKLKTYSTYPDKAEIQLRVKHDKSEWWCTKPLNIFKVLPDNSVIEVFQEKPNDVICKKKYMKFALELL